MNSSLKFVNLTTASSSLFIFLTFSTSLYLDTKTSQLIAKANLLISNFANERSIFWTSHPSG